MLYVVSFRNAVTARSAALILAGIIRIKCLVGMKDNTIIFLYASGLVPPWLDATLLALACIGIYVYASRAKAFFLNGSGGGFCWQWG